MTIGQLAWKQAQTEAGQWKLQDDIQKKCLWENK